MVEFANLPTEILVNCLEHLELSSRVSGRITRPDLLSLSVSNRCLYETAVPVLYRNFIYNGIHDPFGDRLVKYVRALYENPKLAQHVRVIQLHAWCWFKHTGIWDDLKALTNDRIRNSDMLGSFLLSQATQLRVLDVDLLQPGNMLKLHAESIEELYVWPAKGANAPHERRFPFQGMLADFLPHVVRWPRLRTLHMGASAVFGGYVLRDDDAFLPPGTSSLTEIVLRLGGLSPNVLADLLSTPRALTKFSYVPLKSRDMADKSSPVSSAQYLPRTSVVSATLQQHASTLRHLSMGRAAAFWEPEMDTFGTLSNFNMLRSVSIDVVMLLGWRHCSHQIHGALYCGKYTPPLDPLALGSLLPSQLEQVTLGLETYPIDEARTQLVLSIVVGIGTEVQNHRLSRLRNIHFERNGCGYCITCDRADSRHIFSDDALLGCVNALASADTGQILDKAGCKVTFTSSG